MWSKYRTIDQWNIIQKKVSYKYTQTNFYKGTKGEKTWREKKAF
jgi:hypothetical protein